MKILKFFNHKWACGGHLGYVTRTIWTNFRSRVLKSLHMDFKFNWFNVFRRDDFWKCWRTDGGQSDWYTISSLWTFCSGKLKIAASLSLWNLIKPLFPSPQREWLHISVNAGTANAFNRYVTSKQWSLDDSIANLSTDLDVLGFIVDSISVIAYEVESVLDSLQTGKASDSDAINNRIIPWY